ncbi:carbamoyltransferase family protein [Chitinophaga varians]|uniref:carbamoyltransferase family protein n=1 Tax=Chitinophaga varians TaxID=2202339 RepID=UPI00165EE599|nr:carbamoyltransferase C-terminal domain-containing protein [Chitinophaga varians]MBC9912780.1 nodulation protein [Chitinophaga varians]
MFVLGINGSLSLINENRFNISYGEFHDSAAVLLKDGKIVAAFEEERLNRIKHSNKLPLLAIKACLDKCGITASQVDAFAIPMEETNFDALIASYRRIDASFAHASARDFLSHVFRQYFQEDVSPEKFSFVNHHLAHAASSYYLSGFDQSLVLTIDGMGDNLSGGVYQAANNEIEKLTTFSKDHSIGHLYLEVTRLLGFSNFDEYKVMGLAPYGDSAKYRDIFNGVYSLLPEGQFHIDWAEVKKLKVLLPARTAREPMTQDHKDIAAAVQEAIENITFHVLQHYKAMTGATHLCLAGGVALNCTMTGRLRYAGIFDDIFVQPASHDGGIPLGAALAVFYQLVPRAARHKMQHLYLGSECPDKDACEATVNSWRDFVTVRYSKDICSEAAKLIAHGNVIGWFQGASEFGPRALGNRSILADPRPAGNKDLINMKVKMREGFRPFAPSLLAERVEDIFELPDSGREYPFMSFILRVKEAYRPILGATTHVDGTARLHTVAREINPAYHQLIENFAAITGVPVVLNTSFNNNAEPIVDTPEQAINCFLTTDLECLVIHDLILEKKEITAEKILSLYPEVPAFIKLYTTEQGGMQQFVAGNTYNEKKYALSYELYNALNNCDGQSSFYSLLADEIDSGAVDPEALAEEIKELWSLRIIRVSPVLHPVKTSQAARLV